MNIEEIEVVHNRDLKRFEALIDENVYAVIQYSIYKGNLALMHTIVPEKFKGRGIASKLAKFVMEYAEENKLKIMVYCPFISGYLKKNPQFNHLVDREYRAAGF